MSNRTELDALMNQIEEMWAHQDALFSLISESGDWDHEHGSDWTFADVPYHLAYCNRDVVIRPISLGRDLPASEQLRFTTPDDIHAWNARKFAERPAGQTAAQSLAQLQETWEEIRTLTAGMTDADLDRSCWFPFMGGGWSTARASLQFTLSHDWSEFMQLRIHMGRSDPTPSPAITTAYLASMLELVFPTALDRAAAADRQFTAVYAFTDPGVSPFTILVAAGAAKVAPGRPDDADLELHMSAETFESMLRGITPFPDAIQSGDVQVSNLENLGTFGQLFPM